ncbi:hypothetical protein ACFYY2_13465 [Streptomyces sp. NPDC001822]|uniref:hypothetical protein n=1 Tax=Streptomyces sp. NPDC001822 TaxID=3364614 RepID=UPI0036963DAF
MQISARGSAVFGAAALATVLLAALTGCSSGSDEGDRGSTLLSGLGALAGDTGEKHVSFLDAAEVRKLSKDDPKRFTSVSQPSSLLLNPYQPGLLGAQFEVSQIDTAVDTGEAGHWEGSFDVSAMTKALKSGGYAQSEEDGKDVWSHPEGSGATLQVSEDEISYSARDSDPMSAVAPEEGSSLGDDEKFRRAVECLGNVYRADFNPLSSPNPVRLAALGQQAKSAAKNTEVLCFVVEDDVAAKKLEADLRVVVSDKSPKFDGTRVTVEKGDLPVVRAVVPDTATQRPGRLIVTDTELWMTAAG